MQLKVFGFVFAAATIPTLAQDVTYTGTVTGYANVALPGVTVSLVSGGPSTTTDENGQFTLERGNSSLRSPRSVFHLPWISGNAIHFNSTRTQVVTFDVVNVMGEWVGGRRNQKVGAGEQTISIPRWMGNAGVFFIRVSANDQITLLRYITFQPHGSLGATGVPTNAPHALTMRRAKTESVQDTIVYSIAGYNIGKQAVSDSVLDYPIRLIKNGAVERVGYIGSGMNGKGSVFSTLMDGTDERGFETPGVVREVAWSADGRRVAFATADGENAANNFNRAIYVCDHDGANMKLVSHGLHPAWHPNGDWLAWVTNEKSDGDFVTQVWLADMVGDSKIPISVELAGIDLAGAAFPYSVDVRQIYFYPSPHPQIVIDKHVNFFIQDAEPSLEPPKPRWYIQKGAEFSNSTGNFFALKTMKEATSGVDPDMGLVGVAYDGSLMYWEADRVTDSSNVGQKLPFTLHAGIYSATYDWDMDDHSTPHPLESEQIGGVFSPNSIRCLITGWEDRTYKYSGVFSQDPNGNNRIRLPGLRPNPKSWFLANW